MCDSFNLKSSLKTTALLQNFYTKSHYVVHYQALKLYLDLGLELISVHKVLQFKQKPWMKPYIDFNTEKRKEAKDDWEEIFCKNMNNHVYGKTLQDDKKHMNVKIVSQSKTFEKLVGKPTFHSFKIFHKNLVGIQMKKPIIKLCRPIYLGMTILDLSKVLMYKFHYLYIARKFHSKARLLFTDTDSFCYEIMTKDIYKDLIRDKKYFDFSNYPDSHFLYHVDNKKRVGYFKDVSASRPLAEFVGLKTKMYSLNYEMTDKFKKTNIKKVKGVKKSTVDLHISHKDFLKCLYKLHRMRHIMRSIRSQKHQIYSIKQTKVSLNPFDSKRYLLPDKVHTLPYGHYRIVNKRSLDQYANGPPSKFSRRR